MSGGRIGHAVLGKLRDQISAIPHCQSVAIPYDKIASHIRGIVDASLWRFPPFKEGKTEAGFRDTLILETVRHFHDGPIHSDIAFICKDERLKEAARKEFTGVKNFGLFSDLDEYKRFIDLARVRFTPEFLHAVTAKAGSIFNELTWTRAGLEKRVLDQYDLYIGKLVFEKPKGEHPANAVTGLLGLGLLGDVLECTGEPSYEFGSTRLLAVVGDSEFHWKTTILISAPYGRKAKGLIARATGEKAPAFRILFVSSEWSATVTEDQEFKEIRLLRERVTYETFADSREAMDNLRSALDLL